MCKYLRRYCSLCEVLFTFWRGHILFEAAVRLFLLVQVSVMCVNSLLCHHAPLNPASELIFCTLLPLAFHWAKHFCHHPSCSSFFLSFSWSLSSRPWLVSLSASFPWSVLDLCLLDYGHRDPDWSLADVLMSACSQWPLLYKKHFQWMTFKVLLLLSWRIHLLFQKHLCSPCLLPGEHGLNEDFSVLY